MKYGKLEFAHAGTLYRLFFPKSRCLLGTHVSLICGSVRCWSSSSLKLRPSKNKEPIIQLEMFVQDKRVRLDLTRQFLNIQLLNLLRVTRS